MFRKSYLCVPAFFAASTLLCVAVLSDIAAADDVKSANTGFDLKYQNGELKHAARADSHGPIGVMGEHRHHKGELMLSYRTMRMHMEGNLIGDKSVSPETIVTTVPNRFFGTPGQPSTLRVVPTKMNMDMHMFGAMFGISDTVTLMGMVPLIEKEMELVTFQGGAGTNRLGTFTTRSQGLGDISLSAMVGLYDQKSGDAQRHVNLIMGVSAPTGSITERDDVLAPNNTRPTLRLPYAMQLGSGTFDFLPGIVATQRQGNFSFGA